MAGRKRFKSAEWADWNHWEDDVLGITENAVFPDHLNKVEYQPRTLVDQTLETLDPTPNIHTLFVQFNTKYFWNKLLPVEVKWSTRMTSCAGVCSFRSRNGECVIALSAPLLKLRPRKDLVETLLHEMIHAYLFLTNNNRDRDGHGPEFCKHMKRINVEAGTNITIYHSFHDEVRLYQQHWWKCNGPCKDRGPYFGTVRRAMNRAPGPSDSWYAEHQRTCGGVFIKIREPEKQEKVKRKETNSMKKPTKPNVPTLDKWLSPPKSQKENVPAGFVKLGNATNNIHGFGTGGPGSTSSPRPSTSAKPSAAGSASNLPKLGNNANNVHGWGTGGPGSSGSRPTNSSPSSGTTYKVSGVLGGNNSGRSCLIDKFVTPIKKKTANPIDFISPQPKRPRYTEVEAIRNDELQECPVCFNKFSASLINSHLDECLNGPNTSTHDEVFASPVNVSRDKLVKCPVCLMNVKAEDLGAHVDACVLGKAEHPRRDVSRSLSLNDSDDYRRTLPPRIPAPEATGTETEYKCCVCNSMISIEISLEEHLERCLTMIYKDESSDFEDNETPERVEEPEKKGYPCPVCMQIFPEEQMNVHLDLCINVS